MLRRTHDKLELMLDSKSGDSEQIEFTGDVVAG